MSNKSFLVLILMLASGAFSLDATSLTEWKAAFDSRYPSTKPEMTVIGDDDDRYAWNGHYWLRAYAQVADLDGDTAYIRYGLDLIHHMFNNTDRERFKRGEIGMVNYDEAPVDIQKRTWCRSHSTDTRCNGLSYNDSNALAIGWRRTYNGNFRNEVLNDGMITQGILRFLATIKADQRFSKFHNEANSLIIKSKRIVDTHLRNFSTTFYDDVPGSFYYTRTADPFADWGDTTNNRLYSNPVPFNHSATMAASMLLLDSLGQGHPSYRPMAENVLAYLKRHIRVVGDSAYEWNYSLKGTTVEDVGHGHVDMSFIHMAWACGLDLTAQDMQRFARTAKRSYAGNGTQYEFINGTGDISNSGAFSLGYDWIDFIPWDSRLFADAKAVFELQYPKTVAWSKPMLMWINLVRWHQILNTPVAIKQVHIKTPSSSMRVQWNLLGQRLE